MKKLNQRGFGTNNPKSGRVRKRSINEYDSNPSKESHALELISTGRLQEAEDIYKILIHEGTLNYTTYGNLGAVLLMQGKYSESKEFLLKALQINPSHPDCHNNLGLVLRELGNTKEAISSYHTAIRLNPDYTDAHNNLGNALRELGDTTAAIASYKSAIEINPNDPKPHNNLSVILKEEGDLKNAIISCRNAIRLNPSYSEAYINLGNIIRAQGDLGSAVTAYIKAVEVDPLNSNAHNNLGDTLYRQGDFDAAIRSLRRAIDINPANSDAYNNLGNALKEMGNLRAAIDSYRKSIHLNPINPIAHNNLGNALKEQGDIQRAIHSYNEALKLESRNPEVHKNLAIAELLIGDYSNGLTRYEYRLKAGQDGAVLNVSPSCKRWNEVKAEKPNRLLLIAEQGLGDTLQFMRYVIALRKQDISVSICAPKKLHSLIRISGIDQSPIALEEAQLISEGEWMPLLSVPKYLEVSSGKPIISTPYIKTTEELISKWETILNAEQSPIIGINWQGNPLAEKTCLKGRSLTLEAFSPIIVDCHMSLLSLQKGFGSEQLKSCSFKNRFVNCQDEVNATWNFLETAAIISNCDLIITSDTSVAHLAGGMGKTTWLLLQKVPDWRWGIEGETTFWYPSIRLFRQKEHGNWSEVMNRVSEALRDRLQFSQGTTQSAPAISSEKQ